MAVAHLHPYFKLRNKLAPRASGAAPWKVADLCKAYQWPTKLAGGGVIAIVELGGGWTAADMQEFAKANGLTVPQITDVSVDGTKNTPGGDADGEVALDIQVAWTAYHAATGQDPEIRVYWANDIAPAVRAAYKDGCDVCSISWGADEANWGATAAKDMDAAAAEAAGVGMIVFAASGDNDSSDGGPSSANVDVPASCPSVVGCGGTSKTTSSEVVWNNNPGNADGSGTGGGYSTLFPMPAWQSQNGAPSGPGRLVPDVAACADPDTGYEIYFGGEAQVVGGTSAVAPLYAGMFAAFGKKLGRVGAGALLWENRACFADVTQGDNGMYKAAAGPDPCTGLGAPIASKIDGIYAAAAPAPAPSPPPSPTPAPPQRPVTLEEAVAWATSQLPSVFMTKSIAAKHVAAGLTAHWPK